MKRMMFLLLLIPALFILPTGCSDDSTSATSESKSNDEATDHDDTSNEETDKEQAGNQSTYDIEKGDTLSSIAGKFNISEEKLKTWNNLDDPDDIQVGQTLHIQAPDNNQKTNGSDSEAANDQAESNDTGNRDNEGNADASDKTISSGDEAAEYLKQQIDEGNNDDIAFGDMGGEVESDDKGSYYTIELVSKSMRESGGSGTVGHYKVYQNGDYEME